MPLVVGQILGRYRVDALIGRGGMGEVYRGWDPQLNRAVALKVMRDDLDEDEESKVEASSRFAREAKMAARFVSAHFCAIFEVFEHDGIPVLVMEWLDGTTLRARIHDNTLSVEQRIEWITVLARGLAEAHSKGVVHRDFKPGNVLVTKDGALKILDFGLAKRLRVVASANPTETSGFETKTGMILGTERYMAPEQATGASYDERADQFAWAVVAYELLSRMHPQNATSSGAFPVDLPRPLVETTPGVPMRVASAIMRGLSLLPSDRLRSMNEIVVELEAKGEVVVVAHVEAAPPKTLRMPRPPPTTKKEAKTTTFFVSVGATLLIVASILAIALLVAKRKSDVGSLDASPSPSPSSIASSNEPQLDAEAAPNPAPTVVVETPSATTSPSFTAAPRSSRSVVPPAEVTTVSDFATINRNDAGYYYAAPASVRGKHPGARDISFAVGGSKRSATWAAWEIHPALEAAKREIKACYERPDFDGSDANIGVDLNTDPAGHPTTILFNTPDTSRPRQLLKCIDTALRKRTFPPTDAAVGYIFFTINIDR